MTRTKLYLYAASLIVCAGATLNASAAEATDNSADSTAPPSYQPWTVGAEVGTPGIGGFGSWRFDDHLGVRAASTISNGRRTT